MSVENINPFATYQRGYKKPGAKYLADLYKIQNLNIYKVRPRECRAGMEAKVNNYRHKLSDQDRMKRENKRVTERWRETGERKRD